MTSQPVEDNDNSAEDSDALTERTDPGHIARSGDYWGRQTLLDMITAPVGTERVMDDNTLIRVDKLPAGPIGFAAVWGDTLTTWTEGAITDGAFPSSETHKSVIENLLERDPNFSPVFTVTPSVELNPDQGWFAFHMTTDRGQSIRLLPTEGSHFGVLTEVFATVDLKVCHVYAADIKEPVRMILEAIDQQPEMVVVKGSAGEIWVPWDVASRVLTLKIAKPHPRFDNGVWREA